MATNREFLVDELGLTEEEAFETAQGDGYQAGWAAARQACAAEVEAAGCVCGIFQEASTSETASTDYDDGHHEEQCPIALAACLRRLA